MRFFVFCFCFVCVTVVVVIVVVVVVVNEWISSDIGPLLRVQWTSSDEDFRQELRSCGNVEVAVLGSPSLIVLNMVSLDVKQH